MKNNNLISLNRDPIDLFAQWYEEAKKTVTMALVCVAIGMPLVLFGVVLGMHGFVTRHTQYGRDKIAPVELALDQYKPKIITEIAPVK